MLTALLLTTLTLAPTEAIPSAQEPPVKVWLNKNGDLKRGTRVKVYTRVETDGYLMILHAEADGRIRVLFPLDPIHDNYVRGGQDFEVRGRGDREAFQIYVASGVGTVYAAFSRDPFQFGEFVRNNHWDYRLLETWRLNEGLDAQAELTALVSQMAGEGTYFDYDLTQYGVAQQTASSGSGTTVYVGGGWGYGYGYPYWGYPYYGWGWSPYFGFGISWGWGSVGWGWGYPYYPYYPYYWHRPHHYAYYPYYGCCYYGGSYPYYRGGYYYGSNAYYNYGVGAYVLPRYTFKPNHRRGLADGGITTWQRDRRATTSGQFATYSRYVGAVSQRAAPTTVQSGARRVTGTAAPTAGRRVAPVAGTAAQKAGRRVTPAPGTGRTGQAGTAGRPTIERRSVPTSGTPNRQVQPDGWGITDGRRTVPMPDRPGEPGTTQNAGQRTVQPTNLRERTPDPERATPEPRGDAGQSGGRAAPQRRETGPGAAATPGVAGSAGTRQTPQRDTQQPSTQGKNSLRSTLRQITNPQRTAPQPGEAPRTSTPGRPTLERRVSPSEGAPRPSPTQIRSQPSARPPAQPQVRPPSRPTTPRPQARPTPPPRTSTPRPSSGRRPGGRRP